MGRALLQLTIHDNMSPRKHFHQLWTAFSHPKVFIFILLGAGVIFLTFLTENNALEIAISGFASVFIGIGVNNFSSFETSLKDRERLKSYVDHSRQMLQMTRSRLKRLQDETVDGEEVRVKEGLIEMENLISLHSSFIDQINLLP
jgi:hypothetical protein